MQIVIDKDKEIRELEDMLSHLTDEKDIQSVRFAINVIKGMNGTPLPKHHGRLIDADALCKKWVFDAIGKQEIDEAPTIIEGSDNE